jgi:hypothetical protein
MQSETEFLKAIEKKAVEERRIIETELMPSWARGVGEWLVVNPWRVMVPLSMLVYGLWRMVYGVDARELILGLFGGFS